ncbi:MAG: aldose 1-epimerase [Pseudomonadota bacterium]|nr:aldose 1-epimerase [Pseudomonadota bacterium]
MNAPVDPKEATSEAADAAPSAALPPLECVRAGSLVAEIVPAIGGSLAAFYRAGTGDAPRRDWLRAADRDALASRSPLQMACFPLLPWCNRIRDGRFDWNGRRIQLSPNQHGSPHTIHGIGWQRPWHVTARTASRLDLRFDEPGRGEWPFAFSAQQRYELGPDGLAITLTLQNTGSETMPAGIGHHPYFPHRRDGAGTRVHAAVAAMWLADAEVMPTVLSATDPAVAALGTGMRLADFDLDNNFTGFRHNARVTWPDQSSLLLAAEPPLDFFVLYCPAAEKHFVIEAVSNCTDWINLRDRVDHDRIGGAALAPGETLAATTRFVPSLPGQAHL